MNLKKMRAEMAENVEIINKANKEKASFLKYIEAQRADFCRVARNYTVDFHNELRTEIDSLLIAYDQMKARIEK